MRLLESKLVDPSSASKSSNAKRHATVWLAAALLYIALTYPYQPVVFPLLGPFPQVGYAVLCVFGMLLLLSYKNSHSIVEYRTAMLLAAAAMVTAMALTFAAYRNPTVVRDLILLTLTLTLLFRFRGNPQIEVVRALIYINVFFLTLALIVVAAFYSDLLDWPSWRVARTGVPSNSPLALRDAYGGFEYYFPMWVAVIPHAISFDQGFGIEFVRQSLVYIEPTDTWFYTASMLWLAIADEKMAGRRFCIAIMTLALIVSFSIAGILATIAAALFILAVAVGGRALLITSLAAGAAAVALVPVDQVLALLGSNKAEQFIFFKENIALLQDVTLLGHPASLRDEPLSYGILVNLHRYGALGTTVIAAVMIAMAIACFRVLSDSATLGARRFPLFVACLVSLLMAAKYPGIVPAIPALCIATALSWRQVRMNPLHQIGRIA